MSLKDRLDDIDRNAAMSMPQQQQGTASAKSTNPWSDLSALPTLVDAPFLRSQRMTGSEKLRCGVISADE
ncbi:MAG: hypothetical protein GJ676_05840 [Rhodobacteraceae bacterium]|nr:hypothetical protein [Paracoccaceae bacterium]